ncbi:hypothetical protein [Paraburkholderia sp. BL21I4N1]|uniref:hypothetical protein n=1 Tax=Paraburkholderia sp. BL21I4N1 TaxID=1938801 RepID=UPI000D4B2165|nr:hypothetical protein [Paraburkholderia sp. BL21I4N1]PQV53059.1 hypothetical protein B0G83_102142 [Paraburkholderia sp. BL21I4N1]
MFQKRFQIRFKTRLQTHIAFLLAAAGWFGTQAMAADLIATKPGVMCVSAQALAQLTLPGGESRSHGASATPEQLAQAQAGGCIDIQPGVTVTVLTARKNTSVVSYQRPGSTTVETFVVPNIDFSPVFTDDAAALQPAAQTQAQALALAPSPVQASAATPTTPAAPAKTATPAPTVAAPDGYHVTQRAPGLDGDSIELLEDERITPALQKQLWGTGASEEGLPGNDPKPLVKAQLRLVSASGAIAATRQLDYPLARVEPAPLHGLPGPVLFLTIDATAPMGSYSGPATQILMPARQSLDPVQYTADDGKSAALVLAATGKAAWKISPSRKGGADEIQQVACSPDFDKKDSTGDDDDFVTRYETYRFVDGKWLLTRRQRQGIWESDQEFPKRNMFP